MRYPPTVTDLDNCKSVCSKKEQPVEFLTRQIEQNEEKI